jgi:transcriptional regulator with XRE-family HTH domain
MVSYKELSTFGERVHFYRKKRNLSQEELAERVDVHRVHIERIERGETNPPLTTICKIAQALQVKVKDLISF